MHGPSGCGKTTLLGLVAGILVPQAGSVAIFGQALGALSPSARDRLRGAEMGYIFQGFNLIPYLSVRQNIALPCEVHAARRQRLGTTSITTEVERLAAALGLLPLLDQSVTELSTGQQQRVAIARATIGRPGLIIADEPTSALDTDRREQFLALLFELCENAGSTLLFVSHDRSLAGRFSRELSLPVINHAASVREGVA